MGVAEAIPSEPSANRNAAFRCIYEMEHEAMSDNESVINNLDAWRANLNILIQHLDAADKDASREAVFILLLQGLGIFGGPERPMSHLFPVVDSITDCDTREALALRSDSTRAAQGALVNGLVECFGTTPFTTDQVWIIYTAQDAPHGALHEAIEELNVNPKGITSRSLGRLLLRTIGAVHGGWRLGLQDTKRAGSCVWILREITK